MTASLLVTFAAWVSWERDRRRCLPQLASYDARTHEFRSASGQAKYRIATDHLEAPEYARLSPDDLLDLVPRRGLNFQSGPQTGIAFYMISALAVAGRVGLTAVGDDPAQA